MDVHDGRLPGRTDEVLEHRQLLFAAHEGATRALGDDVTEPLGDAHGSNPLTEYGPFPDRVRAWNAGEPAP